MLGSRKVILPTYLITIAVDSFFVYFVFYRRPSIIIEIEESFEEVVVPEEAVGAEETIAEEEAVGGGEVVVPEEAVGAEEIEGAEEAAGGIEEVR